MIFYIDENDENKRLDTFLAEITPDISRSKIQLLIKSGAVKINGSDKKPSCILKEYDKIEFEIPEVEKLTIKPQNIPLDIVYEDENMLVVNKPSGMLTHPTAIEQENTLVNALLYKYGSNLSDINGEFRRGILHRLDRNTSGLLMIAKNNRTHEFLAGQIKNHTINYLELSNCSYNYTNHVSSFYKYVLESLIYFCKEFSLSLLVSLTIVSIAPTILSSMPPAFIFSILSSNTSRELVFLTKLENNPANLIIA